MADYAAGEKTLQELDGQDWGEPPSESYLVRTCYRLRRVPLRDFTVEDLRIIIGQAIGLTVLVPRALDRLTIDPFVAGDFYFGDLLISVVTVPSGFWTQHPDLYSRATMVAGRAIERLGNHDADRHASPRAFIGEALRQSLRTKISAFLTGADDGP